MKLKLLLINALLLTGISYASLSSESFNETKVSAVSSGTPTSGSLNKSSNVIYLNDNTDEEIKSYYVDAGVEGLSGDELLVALKNKLQDMTYYTYSAVGDIYLITERDWENSPASEISSTYGTYDEETNTIINYAFDTDENPYIHMLYYDYSDGSLTHYTGDSSIGGSTRASFDKEHVWSQSHGFKASSGASGPAGTDLHNLIAGDAAVNQWAHNNYSYGNVDSDAWASGTGANYPHTLGNKRGTSVNYDSSVDKENVVFEPQDCDKGDVARALLYMVACYNNLDGSTPTAYNPALKLVDYVVSSSSSGQSSSSLSYGYYGKLSVLLEWHEQDPVDEYEIHRNNLIYNNFQGNRNPFIDYPEWVGYIWGSVDEYGNYDSTPTGYVQLDTDVINDGAGLNLSSSIEITIGETYSLVGTTTDESDISWSIDDTSVATISSATTASGEALEVTGVSEGSAIITATATVEGEEITRECTVIVSEESTTESDDGFIDEPTLDDVADDLGLTTDQLIIVIAVILVVLLVVIVIIAIVVSKNKKAKKKAKSVAKKAVKKASKKAKNKK